ncbi:MAG: hypothetical protein JNK02_00430 [Planctomycetes bacterium]|nr:hypothetical protein [Planctomycetota bacterium]
MKTLPCAQPALLAALPLLVSLAGCHGSAEVVIQSPPPVYQEWEPNDDAWDANRFGLLHPGAHLCIAGSVRDDAWDPQDGFEFTAAGALVVEFVLEPLCGCADLDLWLYDPGLDAFVGAWASPAATERGAFLVAGRPFHLVVVSASGDAEYRLELRASAYHGATGASEEWTGGAASTVERLSGADGRAAPDDYRTSAAPLVPPPAAVVWVLDPEHGVVGRGALRLPVR